MKTHKFRLIQLAAEPSSAQGVNIGVVVDSGPNAVFRFLGDHDLEMKLAEAEIHEVDANAIRIWEQAVERKVTKPDFWDSIKFSITGSSSSALDEFVSTQSSFRIGSIQIDSPEWGSSTQDEAADRLFQEHVLFGT